MYDYNDDNIHIQFCTMTHRYVSFLNGCLNSDVNHFLITNVRSLLECQVRDESLNLEAYHNAFANCTRHDDHIFNLLGSNIH